MSERPANPFEINRRILADRDLDPGAKCLLLVIADLAGHGRRPCTASYQRLADGAGMSRRNAIGVVAKLRDGGYIDVLESRAGSSGGIKILLGARLLGPPHRAANGEAEFTINSEAHFTTNGEAERHRMVKPSVGNGEAERHRMVKPASPKRLNTGAAEPSSNVGPETDDDDGSSSTLPAPDGGKVPAEVLGEIRDILGQADSDEVAANPAQMLEACRGEWSYLVAGARAAAAGGKNVRNRIGLMIERAEGFASTRYVPEKYQPPPKMPAVVAPDYSTEAGFRGRIANWIEIGLQRNAPPDVIRQKVLAQVEAIDQADGQSEDVRLQHRQWAALELERFPIRISPVPQEIAS